MSQTAKRIQRPIRTAVSVQMFDMIPLNRQIGFNSTMIDLLMPRMRIRGTIHFVNYPNYPF